MIEKLKHKYALSDKGAKDMIRAIFAVALANLVLMMPVGLLYFLASYLLDGEVPREKLPFFIAAIVVILLLIVLTTIFQYRSTFFPPMWRAACGEEPLRKSCGRFRFPSLARKTLPI